MWALRCMGTATLVPVAHREAAGSRSRCFHGESAQGCQPGGRLCLLFTAARSTFY